MSEASALLRLQELDLEYSRLKVSAENLPQAEKITATRAAAKKTSSELTKITGQRKDIEIELNDLEVHKGYVVKKIDEVQNTDTTEYRQSQDLEYSLSTLAKKLEKIEFQSNQLLAQLETVEEQEKKAQDTLERLRDQEQDLVLSYKLALETIGKQVKTTLIERNKAAQELSESTLAMYEKARKRFGGVAVETLDGNRPSACRVALQTSSFSDIRRSHKNITTCPYCKRILVVSETDE